MEATYQVNQIVWAKINGYPWWPAYVNNSAEEGHFEVVFFGDFSRAILASSKIKVFDDIKHKSDGKNKTLDQAFKSVERVMSGETTIMDEWQKSTKGIPPKQKLSKKKPVKKAEKSQAEPAEDLSLCLSHRSKTKYQNFLTKMDVEFKPELKRYHSVNNKITTSSYTHFIENQFFSDDISTIEEQLEGLWLMLRSDSFSSESCVESIKEISTKVLSSDPKAVFASSVGSLMTTCANVCRIKTSEPGYAQLLELLKATIREICEFIIKDGFLMENKVANEYIDSSKRNSILNVFNLDISSAPIPDNNLNQMDKRQSPEESLFKIEDEETRSPNTVVEVDERIQFRVKKKLAKVIYTNGARGKMTKKSCEELATKIEELVRNNSKKITDYKEKVINLVKNLEKNTQAVNGLIQKGKRDKGHGSMEEEINNLSNN